MEMWAIPLAALVKAKMFPDGGIQQRGGDASEANDSDGITRRPALDEGAAASGPRDASGEAVEIPPVLVSCEEPA